MFLMNVRGIKKNFAVRRTRSPYQYGHTRIRRTELFHIPRCTVRQTLHYGSEIQNEFEVQPFNGKYAVLVPCSRGLRKSDDSHDRGWE